MYFSLYGYLITTIIINDLENNCFSFLNFYERRARRILPALFFVMFVVFLLRGFGWYQVDERFFTKSSCG